MVFKVFALGRVVPYNVFMVFFLPPNPGQDPSQKSDQKSDEQLVCEYRFQILTLHTCL